MNSFSAQQETDALLYAYLDDELSAEERAAFEKQLHRQPELRKRLEFERQFRAHFRQTVRQTEAPARLHARVEALLEAETSASPASASFRSWLAWLQGAVMLPRWAMAAAALALLILLGGEVIQFVSTPAAPHTSFRRLAGKYDVYFTPEPVLDVHGDGEQIEAWFQSRVAWPVHPPVWPGWTLMGGRLAEFHHEPAVYLLYEGGNQRFAFIEFAPRASDFPEEKRQVVDGRALFVDEAFDHPVILWQEGDVGYGLIGDATQSVEDLVALLFRR